MTERKYSTTRNADSTFSRVQVRQAGKFFFRRQRVPRRLEYEEGEGWGSFSAILKGEIYLFAMFHTY